MLTLRIREIRKQAKLTQKELALRCGISRQTLIALEANRAQSTTTKTLARIAEALNVSVRELFLPE